jgi:3',5'-cyclic AMP phosphodiesterase CpdA
LTLIAQITDPHLRDDGADPCHDPAEALRQAFETIAAMDRRPDAIVLTGDIIDRSAAGYAHVLPLLRAAPAPLLPMAGNHDRAAAFRAAFADRAAFHPGHLSFVQPVGDAILVGLDSNLPGGTGGVDADRLDWLAGVLAHASGPVILALHHPPFPTLAPHLDRGGFVGAADLAGLVSRSPVCRIIAGHSHRGMQTFWAGVVASTAPAIGHGLSLSLTGDHAHRTEHGVAGFDLHIVQSGAVVSHQVMLPASSRQAAIAVDRSRAS